MGALKNYLLGIICECAPENGFAQDAIEWAITSGWVTLTYDPKADKEAIMWDYDEIIEGYQRVVHEQERLEAMLELEQSGEALAFGNGRRAL